MSDLNGDFVDQPTLVPDPNAADLFGKLAITAAGIGTFDWDLASGNLIWDDRLIDMFGYDRSSFDGTIEDFLSRLHPDDRPRITNALETAIEECSDYAFEYRIVTLSGSTRWVSAQGRALADQTGKAVRVVGAAFDTTDRKDGEARVVRVLESMPIAFFSLNRDWKFTYVNGPAEALLGLTRDALLGNDVWELFPGAAGSDFERQYRGAVEKEQPANFDAFYGPPLNAWYEITAWPTPDGLSVFFLNITERRRNEDRVRMAGERAALLASVTSELTETLDAEEAVGRLAQLIVPTLADWCIVTLVDDEAPSLTTSALQDVGWWHCDPAMRPLTQRYADIRLGSLNDDSLLAHALRSGEPIVIDDAVETVVPLLDDEEAREIFRRLAPSSGMVLPLRGRGRTVGLVTLYNGDGRQGFSSDDVTATREVAGRAGLALDNARLYRQQRVLAENLQRSMLTDPPEPDHVHVAVRYESAAEAAQVGGDWYDSFIQLNGATMMVIGDVIGHDAQAAAAMSQIRSMLRGIAVTTEGSPAEVLSDVDVAMQRLEIDTTATVVVARVEQTEEERDRGVTRVRWSNAGHPPPMVIHKDGSVSTLDGDGCDLLLGIDAATARNESVVTLERGSTVFLYTDGLVERSGQSLDEGLAKLKAALRRLAHHDLDDLCEAVLQQMLPGPRDDDVAILAARLHREDKPRPTEAGPNRLPPGIPGHPNS